MRHIWRVNMRIIFVSSLVMITSACTTVSTSEQFSFDGISTVSVDIDKGTVDYRGSQTASSVDVDITSWANAGGQAKAEQKQSENVYSASTEGGVLNVRGNTAYVQAGIDVLVDGPDFMDLDLSSRSGSVIVQDVIGISQLSGYSVTARNYEGDLTVSADSSVNVEVYPYEMGLISIQSTSGDCVVRLPTYAPLAVTIEFDPEQESSFADLGFDDEFLDNGTYIASRHPADISVTIRCPNGQVELLEHSMLTW